MRSKQIYLICPVRKCTQKQAAEMLFYVGELEQQGHKVHFPPRDVDQSNDNGGVRICEQHRVALFHADEVHVWWDRSSSGCHFDLGMAFAMKMFHSNLKFFLANPHEVKVVEEKSFQNVLMNLVEPEDEHTTDKSE